MPLRTLSLAAALVLAVGVMIYLADQSGPGPSRDAEQAAAVSNLTLRDIPFNGERAFGYLKKLCEIGRRPSGSSGMQAQQKYLEAFFTKAGAQVEYQRFQAKHPQTGAPVEMANMIVQFHPQAKERILFCAHYDTLPYPMLDRRDRQGTFVGANDNAGGVAILMELANEIPKMKGPLGVDFVLLDGEEFIFDRGDRFFLGSEHFARDYAKNPPKHRYRWGILLDMVSDKDLQIHYESNSIGWKDTRELARGVWQTARKLGVREFVPREGYTVSDDHVPLHDIGKIPIIDVIDFQYPAWHTSDDTPEQCSALSMAKVGWVMLEWLKNAP